MHHLRGYDHDFVFQRHQNGLFSFMCIVRRHQPALYHTLGRVSCKMDTELVWLMNTIILGFACQICVICEALVAQRTRVISSIVTLW